jgi:membrane protease YdiL (CAAX protease family)
MKQRILNSTFSLWNRVPLIIRAIVSGCLVSSVGVFAWGAILSLFPVAWSILPMVVILWVYWKFFSGKWGSTDAAKIRKERFRLTNLKPAIWKWGLAAAVFFVIIIQASFVITFRLIAFPAAKFTADYKLLDTFPLWVAWAILIMSSIVAGICEEAGFRGYMQVPLEKKYGPVAGIIITSVVFMLIHLGHSWASPILPHIFFASVLLGILAYKSGSLIPGIIGHSILDIFDYSVWWTDLTGGFQKQTIFKTGIDLHFIVWGLIFLFAIFGFFRVIVRLNEWNKNSYADTNYPEQDLVSPVKLAEKT